MEFTKRFEIGKIYEMSCTYNCREAWKAIKRTACMVTFEGVTGADKGRIKTIKVTGRDSECYGMEAGHLNSCDWLVCKDEITDWDKWNEDVREAFYRYFYD